jgi:hypothetical protein
MKGTSLKLMDHRTLSPIRDQVLVSPLSFDAPVTGATAGPELSHLAETDGGLLVAADIREHATSEAKKVYKLWVVLKVGPQAEEKAGIRLGEGDVLLADEHYKHDTNVPGGAGLWLTSVEAFVCHCGRMDIEIPDDPEDGGN